jgi:hypothetical protein
MDLLSSSVLPLLDPVVPVALAGLGVLVGVGISDRTLAIPRLLGAATLASAIPLVVVALGLGFFTGTIGAVSPLPPWALALVFGVCAATTLTLPSGNPLEPRSFVTRLAEAGALLPIVIGGIVLATVRAESAGAAVLLLAEAVAVTLAVAAAGWLLLTRTSSQTEEAIFAFATLLLVGGAAQALGQSALFAGLIAGVCWRFAGGRPRDTIARDVLFARHPLLVLVLLVAGARADLSWTAAVLGGAYFVFRACAVLVGDAVAMRATGGRLLRAQRLRLLRPGVFGVAFAVNAAGVTGGNHATLLGTLVVGTIATECAALLLSPRADLE